ncbi:MAG TPA: NAD(P)/FAD-dependent oxidoreductase, partial [Myxococcaceae bacterium]|nr:NAD(P)/FAD-dependent oxidoreductase [Myxococcaceae bacterium]
MNRNGERYGRALVIGGGIAGPVVGMALQRVGIESAVFEASPVPSDGVGAFLTLASNGLDALQAIDAHRPVVAAGVRTERMVLSSGTGKFLGVVEAGIPLTDGTTTTTIERAQLYRLLHDEALERGIPVVHGKRLVDLEQSPDGVVARFADGTEERGGFLVGADGIWSTTRQLLDPEAPRPEYTGLLGVGGVARGVDLKATPSSFEMVFGTRAFFGFLPAEDGRVLWFANLPTRPEPDRAALDAVSPSAWRDRLLEAFGEDAVPVRDLVEATGEAALRAAAMHTMEPPHSWHRGRAVLVGDAAHATSPSSGQGASLAAEDAVELARCLRDVPDLGAAFHAY